MQRIRASWQLLGVLLLALLAMQQVLAVSVMRTQRATETTADAPELNVVTFNQVVGGNKAVLVDFYAPWCPHCMHFMPVMGQLAQQYASSNNVAVATVNAVASRELADSMGVTSYPTVKFFPAGSRVGMDYSGGRDLGSLTSFINSRVGGASAAPAAAASIAAAPAMMQNGAPLAGGWVRPSVVQQGQLHP